MIMVFATALQHVNSIKPQLERIMIARIRIVVLFIFEMHIRWMISSHLCCMVVSYDLIQ